MCVGGRALYKTHSSRGLCPGISWDVFTFGSLSQISSTGPLMYVLFYYTILHDVEYHQLHAKLL